MKPNALYKFRELNQGGPAFWRRAMDYAGEPPPEEQMSTQKEHHHQKVGSQRVKPSSRGQGELEKKTHYNSYPRMFSLQIQAAVFIRVRSPKNMPLKCMRSQVCTPLQIVAGCCCWLLLLLLAAAGCCCCCCWLLLLLLLLAAAGCCCCCCLAAAGCWLLLLAAAAAAGCCCCGCCCWLLLLLAAAATHCWDLQKQRK